MKKIIFLMIACGMFCCAQAATDDESAWLKRACKNSGEELIEKLSQGLIRADQTFPNIPPEEAKYINDEDAAITRMLMEKGNDKDYSVIADRMVVLSKRPLYKVSKVRTALTYATESVNKIASNDSGSIHHSKSVNANKLYLSILAISPISNYLREMAELRQTNIPPGMQRSQVMYLHIEALDMPGILQAYMTCKFGRTMYNQ